MRPINLYFSLEEMTAFLEKRGYEIKQVEVSVPCHTVGNSMREDIHLSYQVFLNGENACPWGKEMPGIYSVEFVFERVLKDCLLQL